VSLAPDDSRHGTYNGYNKHGCSCAECRAANAEYQREYRKSPEAKARARSRSRATSRALWRLADAHADEYQTLYVEELAAERKRADA